jgi:HEAT repeat protein
MADLPKLITGLRSEDWRERFEVTFTLAQMGEGANAAVTALIEVLADDDVLLRKMAVVALGAIGTHAIAAAQALIDVLLYDEEPSVRRLAAVSLGQIGAQEARSAVRVHCSGTLASKPGYCQASSPLTCSVL